MSSVDCCGRFDGVVQGKELEAILQEEGVIGPEEEEEIKSLTEEEEAHLDDTVEDEESVDEEGVVSAVSVYTIF